MCVCVFVCVWRCVSVCPNACWNYLYLDLDQTFAHAAALVNAALHNHLFPSPALRLNKLNAQISLHMQSYLWWGLLESALWREDVWRISVFSTLKICANKKEWIDWNWLNEWIGIAFVHSLNTARCQFCRNLSSFFREGPGRRLQCLSQQITNFCLDVLTLQSSLFSPLKISHVSFTSIEILSKSVRWLAWYRTCCFTTAHEIYIMKPIQSLTMLIWYGWGPSPNWVNHETYIESNYAYLVWLGPFTCSHPSFITVQMQSCIRKVVILGYVIQKFIGSWQVFAFSGKSFTRNNQQRVLHAMCRQSKSTPRNWTGVLGTCSTALWPLGYSNW